MLNMSNNKGLCEKIGGYFGELEKWPTWQNIILGQFLSILLCVRSIFSHMASKTAIGVMPTGQSFLFYMLLCMVYTTWLACRSGKSGLIYVLKTRGWRYFLLCLIDVQANTLTSASHQFTSVASIQLLGCVSIPVALVLTCLVLGVRYRMVHILAVSVCLLGVGCLVWADIEEQVINGKNQLMGDMLCLGGAILFTVVTVLQELSVKTTDVIEYLGSLGLFGSIISGVQMMFLEKQTVTLIRWDDSSASLFIIAYGMLQFIFFSLVALMIQNTGTTALHLSLLSANYYTFVLGTLLLDYKCHVLYFLSVFLIMIGIFIYSIKQAPISVHHTQAIHQNNQNNICERQEHQNSMDGSVELLSNLGAVSYNNEFIHQSVSIDTTLTSFYGSNINFPSTFSSNQ